MVTIVVPAYNEEAVLDDCLKAIRNSSFRDYEIIAVDDGSTDDTAKIAREYSDKVIDIPGNKGLAEARRAGFAVARGEVVISIDADVVVKRETIAKVVSYFKENKEIDAVTGMVERYCPFEGFYSQYKNLYMHYIFAELPSKVSFLYGSIHAVRKELISFYRPRVFVEDAEFGQILVEAGKKIVLMKDLEVTHYKKFTFMSLVRNDFIIPFGMARIFIARSGWMQLWRRKVGFLHSPKEQLVSVMLAPFILFLVLFGAPIVIVSGSILFWGLLNAGFIMFLTREKGVWFGLRAMVFTFLDHIVMAAGIACGFMTETLSWMFLGKNNEE